MKTVESGEKARTPAGVVKSIRKRLGITQRELSEALDISLKAVQSYEQGWRSVPTRVIREMLLLVALQQGSVNGGKPCWEMMSCPEDLRERCLATKISGGRYCWLISSTKCAEIRRPKKDEILMCLDCPVFVRTLDGRPL
jgi:DNA-binding XRE family transcriptional regulator